MDLDTCNLPSHKTCRPYRNVYKLHYLPLGKEYTQSSSFPLAMK